jgi:hypothetical protein
MELSNRLVRFGRWWIQLIEGRSLAEQRAIGFLKRNLSPAQRSQLEGDGCFDVIGGTTGTRYRIRRGYQLNVEQLDAKGYCVRVLCFMPEGRLPIGDIMLAQKLALELFETDAIDVANGLPNEGLIALARARQRSIRLSWPG